METFKLIVVGQEGQSVPVPGHPDQPTLAERVKQNLKPSTDAAAGFAAQAAASAKAADDSAKLASQISGLETVADAIGLTTLPLPDVWAPLSDSLRLITGYGREVKVGDDVVGRYVTITRATTAWYFDKSGVLRQAAINEPRFEAEGLLIEGPSTNLHKFSWFDGTYRSDQVAYNVNYTAVADPNFSFTVGRFSRDATTATHTFVNRNIGASAGTYCACALVKDAGAGSAEVWLRDQMSNGNFSRTNLNFQTGQVVNAQGGNFTQCAGGAIKKDNGWWLVWAAGTIPADATLQNQVYVKSSAGEAGSDAEAILCAFTQIEAASFPSSYIHTNGAPATRAADFPSIPAMNGGTERVTVAVTVSMKWPSAAAPNAAPRVFSVRAAGTSARAWDASVAPSSNGLEINANNFGGLSNGGSVVANFKSGQVFTGIKTPTGLNTVTPSGRTNGTQGTASGFEDLMYLGCQKGVSTRHLNGHLRDLKIWYFEATDPQIKALK
ncbi:phage head spike fiber domain-containing protein [Aeromonas hydrophila]|uniref:phage head spike fiber domain-containing protein n=1 Tax=Aeromonas hydrophila TaxID=644 RepID=UPI003F796499